MLEMAHLETKTAAPMPVGNGGSKEYPAKSNFLPEHYIQSRQDAILSRFPIIARHVGFSEDDLFVGGKA